MGRKSKLQISHNKTIDRVNRSVKKNYKTISFRLHNTKDIKVIEAIEKSENKTDFIRSCILKEIEK